MNSLRDCRLALTLSQPQFATLLGVSVETYRTWDAGRRVPSSEVLARARELVNLTAKNRPLLLRELARLLGVHERTLRKAARDGRLAVTYDARVFFGHLVARATLDAGRTFKRQYYRQTTRWNRPVAPTPFPAVPENYHTRLIGLRRRLGLTQSQFARQVGAANKAVVYQWETRKRRPSPLFWKKIRQLEKQALQGRC